MIKNMWLIALLLAGCASIPKKPEPKHLVLMTDFGLKDGAVSAMKGVAFTISPGLVISDLTHEIPPYNIWEASYRLQQTYVYWPVGTVFVTVVDPGVGSHRTPIVAKTKSGYYFVGPDNGHLTLLKEDIEAVRAIDENSQRRKGSEMSYTFHGRDLFVLVGTRLASGTLAFENIGPVATRPLIELPQQLPEMKNGELAGQITVLDPNFGNVWTNIPKGYVAKNFAGIKDFHVTILNGSRTVYQGDLRLADTFSAVPQGKPLLYFNSLLNLSLALNQGDFAAKHHIRSGREWFIRLRAK